MKMKKILWVILFIALSSSLLAQILIVENEVDIRVSYEYSYKLDSLSDGYNRDKVYLDITKNNSSYYCNTQNQRDSVRNVELQTGGDPYGTIDKMKKFKGGGKYLIRKIFNQSRYEYYERLAFSTVVSRGLLDLPNWQILSETKEIDGYLCQKAVVEHLGRRWTAWYTEEIPIPDGPWFLHGLPGLVLEAFDSNKYFIMEFAGIQKFEMPKEFTIYVAAALNEEMKELGLKQVQRVLALFYEDMNAFIAFDDPGRGVFFESPPKRPYIPIINL